MVMGRYLKNGRYVSSRQRAENFMTRGQVRAFWFITIMLLVLMASCGGN
jgi:hypothetical protein